MRFFVSYADRQISGARTGSGHATADDTFPTVEYLQNRISNLLRHSIAPNSINTYKKAITSLNAFRCKYGFPNKWPASYHEIVLFITYLYENNYSAATIKTYLSGIGFYHKVNNWYDPMEFFMVKKLLEGCKRLKNKKDIREPITYLKLKNICSVLPLVCFDGFESRLFQAAFILAYFGLFRISELVVTTASQSDRPLRYSDVSFIKMNSVIKITIRYSKTNQAGTPIIMCIPCEQDSNLCPVCALQRYCCIRPKIQGYMFVHSDGRPVTQTQFSAVLAKAVRMCGFENHFRSHSFRIGRATQLALEGTSMDIIKRLGRWRSDASRLYVR